MALTKSQMVELGSFAPGFSLVDTVSGRVCTLPEKNSCKAVLVMFICNHCPYVTHVAAELAKIGKDYAQLGIEIFAISSNDKNNYPADAPDKMKEVALANAYSFPYLFDDSQSVAKDYGAVCTPDFFLYEAKLELVYRGQLDDSRPGSGIPVTGCDLRRAMDSLLAGRKLEGVQNPSMGCNIKWRK